MMQPKKIIFYSFIVFGLVVLLSWLGSAAYSAWQGYVFQKQTDAFQMALSKPYREDTYGGKTPEETWAMFLDALKKDDLELASKYIVPEKRAQKLKDLNQAKTENRLSEIISKYSATLEKEDENQERKSFILPLKNEQNIIEAYLLVFSLNPYTKVWKISLL